MRILLPSNSVDRPGSAIIVVPCFNEEQRLDCQSFRRFAHANSSVRFVLVDDGSVDGTARLLNDLAASCPDSFSVLSLKTNRGKAEAVRSGLQRAIQMKPDYVGYWDADLATPLDAIDSFCSVLDQQQGIEVVVGSRLPLLGRQIVRHPGRAKLGRAFALAASAVLGFRIRDTQCGAKLFRANKMMEVAIDQPFSSSWIFDVELLRRLCVIHHSESSNLIYELPLEVWQEKPGSKLKPKHFLKAAVELLSIFWRYAGQRRQEYCEQSNARLSKLARDEQRSESELERKQSKAA
jgi:glycosyltransferase involved in cell wall biosynthesis